jgi:2-phospho-L-lactate guanylyltransferase
MSVWAIIPVKPLARAKSRLAPAYSPAQRRAIAETLMRHVIGVARRAPQVKGVLVISRDSSALAIARLLGAQTVTEGEQSELNSALLRATRILTERGAASVLVLPADLPLITTDDIAAIVRLGDDLTEPRSVVIAPDAHEEGTNALFIRPPGLIAYGYGIDSFARHSAAARAAGAAVQVYRSGWVALDIDTPHDLERYARISGAPLIAGTDAAEPGSVPEPRHG